MVGASRFFFLLSTPFPLPLLPYRSRSLLQFTRRNSHNLRKFISHPLTPIPLSSSSSSSHHYYLCNSTSSSSLSPIGASQQFHTQTSIDDDLKIEGSAYDNHSPSWSSHPWPEWSTFVENLSASGYSRLAGNNSVDDELLASEDLQSEFVHAAYACLEFARERPNLLRLLRKRDIEVLVERGKPLLFKNADSSARKMQLFINSGGANDLDADKAQTVDLMRYLLSYVSGKVSSSENNQYQRDIAESSVRKLLGELSKLGFGAPGSNLTGTVNQFSYRHGQTASPLGQKVEMKRGDWICTRCSFMNFTRNVKCLECEEARPKRQLTGGEWECPQCDFFNYGRNVVCLRCDCKRPGEISVDSSKTISGIGYGGNGNSANIDERLAANEEKAQRWFSKISQMDSSSDMNKAMADEDFPEIMPLRKGVNRFVVSTKKTPLERRSANTQYSQNLGNNGFQESNISQPDGTNNSLDPPISEKLDEILGKSRSLPNIGRNNSDSFSGSSPIQYGQSKGTNSNYVPFVPLPPDMFAQRPNSSTKETEMSARDDHKAADSTGEQNFMPLRENSQNQEESINKIKEDEKSERWFKRVAELHNVTDLGNAISDEDFPEIMPMRKGDNRFVVSKKKDRSLTSPAYKRRAAMEQAGNNNTFVPFVPFPPDYFAKKDKPAHENSTSDVPDKTQEQANNAGESAQPIDSRKNMSQNETDGTYGAMVGQTLVSPQSRREDNSKNTPSEVPNIREKWSGKSLEGSAVKEPDPLDMSEEAKAERWFRRVAQIKDISELSQIPDEDFPSIMPMRKGVNRFVVSKRKTPLERRLTSSQYQRNLPVVSSDPLKNENDGS